MVEISIVLVLIGLTICLMDFRLGLYTTLVVGFLQDPLRKLIPDEPVYVTALVVVFAIATYVGGKMKNSIRPFESVPGWDEQLKIPIEVFALFTAFQCVMAYVYSGSIFLAGIGFLAYLSPFPALQMSFSFASTVERIRTFLWLYVTVNLVMTATVYLAWLGVDWEIFRSVGVPLIVYSAETGAPLALPNGLFRVPELAAWHTASGACVVLILGLSSKRAAVAAFCTLAAMFFVGAVLLTGRRKFLVEIMVFMPMLWLMLFRFKLGSGRFVGGLFVAALLGTVVAGAGLSFGTAISGFSESTLRGEANDETAFDRLYNATVGSLPGAFQENGFLGSGAGSGSQGAQYFGGGSDVVGYGAEGGLGKVLAEVGVPGMALFLWMGYRLAKYIWGTLILLAKGDMRIARLAVGLTAFLSANAIVFITAHQAFGDVFVLLVLGIFLGFILAIRRFQSGPVAPYPSGVPAPLPISDRSV